MQRLYQLAATIASQLENNEPSRESTPRGFHSPKYCSPKLVSEFVQAFFSPECDQASWPVKKSALSVALLLFGPNFKEWCRQTTKGSFYYKRTDEFLDDTITFIHTGRRRLSIQNWKGLLVNVFDLGTPDELYRVQREVFTHPVTYTMSECLSLWCAHPKGLQDMVCTLDILFGDAKDHTEEPYQPVFRVRL